MCKKTLDTLFDEADNGICTNASTSDDYAGLVSLNEGLDTLMYGLGNQEGIIIETSEEKK